MGVGAKDDGNMAHLKHAISQLAADALEVQRKSNMAFPPGELAKGPLGTCIHNCIGLFDHH